MEKSKAGLLIVVFGLLIGVPLASFFIVPSISAPSTEYFPLGADTYWIFDSDDGVDTWETKRYVGEETPFLPNVFFGELCVLWTEAHKYTGDPDYTWQNQMWLSKKGTCLRWWGFEDTSARVIVDDPFTYACDPITAGQVHRCSSSATLTLKGSGQQMTVVFKGNYTIDALETIVTPAGTFDDCIKMHEEEITPDGDISFYVWYAPDVGPVKYYYPDQSRIDLLTSYDTTGANDIWEDWKLSYIPTFIWISIADVGVIVAILIIYSKIKK